MPAELPKLPGEWNHKIFRQQPAFDMLALEAFHYQYAHNTVYAKFADAVGKSAATVRSASDIPYLPISFFKTHTVTCGSFTPEAVFESSGTTQTVNSRHLVKDLSLYTESFMHAFELFYGPVSSWCILGLLPAYLERQHSSLVVMADALVKRSGHPQSGFYLYDHERLFHTIRELEQRGQRTLLLGVTFALLDFAEAFPVKLNHTIVMETGGMKGRREEWTRQQVHDYLKERLGLSVVHSEYGMTELLSQAYSKGNGLFQCPPWMRVSFREEDDPFTASAGAGIINVTDLANIHSCCFIATEDAGKLHSDGSFEITGRVDHSDLRGCSLMSI